MDQNQKNKKNQADYLKFAGMGFQFLAACLLGFLLGKFLDQKFGSTRGLWTAICTTVFMVAVMVSIFIDVLKKKPK